MSQRFEGKNLDEALTAATQAFGVERHQLTYHVLLEKRGFLGGVKRVVIEAEINEAAVVQPPPQQAAQPSAPSGPPPARRERGPRGGRGGGGRRDNRGTGGGGGRGDRRRRRPHD